MPRYTDIDNLIAEYDRVHVGPAGGARKLMTEAPIADVAPKIEVAREIFWEIDKLLTRIITDDESGSQFIGVDMQKYYKLKKKYTEGNDG